MSIVPIQNVFRRSADSSGKSFRVRWRRVPITKSVDLVIPIATETLKSRTETLKKVIFSIKKVSKTIKKVIIFIKKLNVSIEKLIIFIEKLNISIEKVIIFIKKLNISIEKVPFFIEKGTKKQRNSEHLLR